MTALLLLMFGAAMLGAFIVGLLPRLIAGAAEALVRAFIGDRR